MVRTADTIAELDLSIDLIVTSPLARAYQTAEIVADRLAMLDRLITDPRLAPGFGPHHLAEMLPAHPGLGGLMLVGHEPDFSDTISTMIGGGHVVCKKGGLARVDVPDGGWLEGDLVWLIPPKALIL
jgi:phosphohistidine phosphatase